MKVLQTDFRGDHNLGLFGKASDKFCVVGNFVSEKNKLEMEKFLGVRVECLTVSNTDLVGIFSCMNSNGILVPRILTSREADLLKKIKMEFGVNVRLLSSKFNALGNLVLCNDRGAVINKNFSKKDSKLIGDCLDVETCISTVAGMDVVGSCGIATNKGCLLHRDADEDELKIVKEILKVDVDIGTANFGSPFVGSCAIANSNGAAAGLSTTGPEINRMMEALDLL
jgi:translation initiation factor 6